MGSVDSSASGTHAAVVCAVASNTSQASFVIKSPILSCIDGVAAQLHNAQGRHAFTHRNTQHCLETDSGQLKYQRMGQRILR